MKQIPEENKSALTSISSLGEFKLIDHITKNFKLDENLVLKGVGDDAAVVRPKDGFVQVYSTDMLLEGVHFDLAYVPLSHLGYKAVAVNLSDIAAMNAIPYGITFSLGVSSRFPVEAIEELYKGVEAACAKYGVNLLGGDTTSSRQGLILSVTAFGHEKEENIVYRDGAQDKDLICVTGDLGGAYAGYLVLDREKTVFLDNPDLQPDLLDYDYVVGRQLKPEPRLDVLQKFRDLGIQPTAMMDISDGLASELHHICGQSGKGCMVYAHKLPVDWQTNKVAEEFEIGPATFALNGGEDYELVFTVPVTDFQKVRQIEGVQIVGSINDDEGILQVSLDSGQVADMEAQGWQHFSS